MLLRGWPADRNTDMVTVLLGQADTAQFRDVTVNGQADGQRVETPLLPHHQ